MSGQLASRHFGIRFTLRQVSEISPVFGNFGTEPKNDSQSQVRHKIIAIISIAK